jgi:putative transposase
MIALIDDHRAIHGVESICRTPPIAPSGFYARLTVRADPSKASARQQRDAVLRPKIKKVWNDNWQVHGALLM